MFSVLPESRARRARRTGGTVASLIAHGAVVAVVAGLANARPTDARPVVDPPVIVRFPLPEHPRPHGPVSAPSPHTTPQTGDGPIVHIEVPPVTPVGIPPIDVSTPAPDPDRIVLGGPPLTNGVTSASGSLAPGTIVDGPAADRAPRMIDDRILPRYPAELRAAGITGHVVVQFVVDTTGRAERDGIEVLSSSHAAFTDAVLATLPRLRFAPGEVAGQRVRTRVAVPFDFRM